MTKSKVYLLDSNVLIALATPEHSLNARAAAWFRKGHLFATCPITQGALVRFHLRAGVDATAKSAKLLLESISALPRHRFWPDDVSCLDMKHRPRFMQERHSYAESIRRRRKRQSLLLLVLLVVAAGSVFAPPSLFDARSPFALSPLLVCAGGVVVAPFA